MIRGLDDWPASAMLARIDTGGIHAPAPPGSSLTNPVETWPDLLHMDRGADVNRVILFVS